jgi:hypothetical protein
MQEKSELHKIKDQRREINLIPCLGKDGELAIAALEKRGLYAIMIEINKIEKNTTNFNSLDFCILIAHTLRMAYYRILETQF